MNSQKHILFVSSWYPNRNNATHGIFNLYFARAVSLYNNVSVLHVCSEENLNQEFEIVTNQENTIYNTYVYYKKVKSKDSIFALFKKKKLFSQAFEIGFQTILKEKAKPQLIHLNVAMPAGIGVLELSKKFNIPFVVNENWSGYTTEDGNYKGFFLKYFTRKIISQAKKIMPTSLYLQNAMLNHGLNGDYEIVPNVVDTNKFAPRVNSEDSNQFIHISSLIEREKNVSGIIRAFATASKQNDKISLVIVGDGGERKELEKLVEQLSMKVKITFKGRLMNQDLVAEINKSKALIMFSHFETFCLVNIEAFACGKPVITSNAGAIPNYMNEQLGIMVQKNNEDELKKAIIKVSASNTKFDANYIRNFALNYNYEKIGKQLDTIYSKILN